MTDGELKKREQQITESLDLLLDLFAETKGTASLLVAILENIETPGEHARGLALFNSVNKAICAVEEGAISIARACKTVAWHTCGAQHTEYEEVISYKRKWVERFMKRRKEDSDARSR